MYCTNRGHNIKAKRKADNAIYYIKTEIDGKEDFVNEIRHIPHHQLYREMTALLCKLPQTFSKLMLN